MQPARVTMPASCEIWEVPCKLPLDGVDVDTPRMSNQEALVPPTNQQALVPPTNQQALVPPTNQQALVPLLVTRGAGAAIDFYVRALGAEVLARYEHGPARRVSHADLRLPATTTIGGNAWGIASFAVTEEARAWNSDSPALLGGSPVVLQLFVGDVDAVVERMQGAGAAVVFPVQELLGERMARLRDPFGHLWLLRQRVEDLPVEEIQRRRDELFARFASPEAPGARSPAHLEDVTTLSDRAAPWQVQGAGAPRRGAIHLVVGPVGAGKSTFATGLAGEHAAVRLTLDEWMARLFSPDRPAEGLVEWYVERASRCIEQIWSAAKSLVETGTPVILEIGLLQRTERERFYERIAEAGVACTLYVVDAARNVRRARVMKRNEAKGATFSMVVPPAIFELASDRWEAPDAEECAGREVRFIRTDAR
jgi:predicted kinase/uncharacterized glyoxalase superfamily protein PhnB